MVWRERLHVKKNSKKRRDLSLNASLTQLPCPCAAVWTLKFNFTLSVREVEWIGSNEDVPRGRGVSLFVLISGTFSLSLFPDATEESWKAACWWFLTEGQTVIPVLAARNYLLQAGLFLQSSGKDWVKCRPQKRLWKLSVQELPHFSFTFSSTTQSVSFHLSYNLPCFCCDCFVKVMDRCQYTEGLFVKDRDGTIQDFQIRMTSGSLRLNPVFHS